jgi:hypothetical protein|nr:MAG TPA: hypothetical protein [Caudoviricetes sp.]
MTIAIIDADIIGRRKHRFPNLVCLKLSSYHKSIGDIVILKTDYNNLQEFDKVYIACVFTSTNVPKDVLILSNVEYGGTGFFYDKAVPLPYHIEHIKPDYSLYDNWIENQTSNGIKASEFRCYKDYSIGYTTRGCCRQCSFCVNRNSNGSIKHSPISEFVDNSRKKITLLDDNLFACRDWKNILQELQSTGKPFQFKQGLDERLLTDEMCEMLANSKYDGEYIFAFDNYKDAPLIEKKLKMFIKYSNAICKFYCFCGFDRDDMWDATFWRNDIIELLSRIEILMKNRCLPYVMRYERYEESPYRGMYILLANWCNLPAFFKKKTLREFSVIKGENSAYARYFRKMIEDIPETEYFCDLRFDK